jgi:hypothetical protein
MERRILALLGVSALVGGIVACSSSKPATPVAPSTTSTSAADGTTLKVNPASLQSPINDQKLTTDTVVLTTAPASPQFASGLSLFYHYQLLTSAGALVQEATILATSWQVTATLVGNARYSWRVRPEYQGEAGPWSAAATFITREPFVINDKLTDGRTVGTQVGGHFLAGQGWQSDTFSDGIDYDLPTPCPFCTLEFDATNFGSQEGLPFLKDFKWVTMGDAGAFGSFGAFRDHPWKMHLVQRADFATGMEIIWRNGGTDPSGGDPGDHRIKLISTPIDFHSSNVYHFVLDWGTAGYTISVNGTEVLSDGWDHWYEPPNHRISLGCYPRGETMIGTIWRNVTLKRKPDLSR